MGDENEPNLEDYINYDGAILAISSLREQFKVVSDFVQDPKATIAKAKKEYSDRLNQFSTYKFTLHKLSNVFTPLARHQAEISLLLNIENCMSADRALIDLCDQALEFKPGDEGYNYERLRSKMIETGAHVIVWSEHVSNCLDVLRGNEKAVKVLNGPV